MCVCVYVCVGVCARARKEAPRIKYNEDVIFNSIFQVARVVPLADSFFVYLHHIHRINERRRKRSKTS